MFPGSVSGGHILLFWTETVIHAALGGPGFVPLNEKTVDKIQLFMRVTKR